MGTLSWHSKALQIGHSWLYQTCLTSKRLHVLLCKHRNGVGYFITHLYDSPARRSVPLLRGVSGDGMTAAMAADEPPFWCCLAGDGREPSSSCCTSGGDCGVASAQTGSWADAAALVAPGLSDMSRARIPSYTPRRRWRRWRVDATAENASDRNANRGRWRNGNVLDSGIIYFFIFFFNIFNIYYTHAPADVYNTDADDRSYGIIIILLWYILCVIQRWTHRDGGLFDTNRSG